MIPITHVYFYRNIRMSLKKQVIDTGEATKAIRKALHTAPQYVFNQIFHEMCHYGFLKKLNRKTYIVVTNHKNNFQLKRIKGKENVFPFNPFNS